MLENVSYGPNGFAMHEENYAMENEYNRNHSSMQMMLPQYPRQQMPYGSGIPSAYPDGGWNVNTRYHDGWSRPNMHQNDWPSNTGYYSHATGGKYHGMIAPRGMYSKNKRINSESDTYQTGPGGMRMQNYGDQWESYDDFANEVHNGREKVEWKNL